MRTRVVVSAALCTLALGACGSSVGLTQTGSTTGASTSTPSSGMSMSMGTSTGSTSVPEVNGVKPVPSQELADATWQGMAIQARTMTPIPFYIYNGTKMQEVKPGQHASFHLMVMLSDEHTHEPIPYATVWATIRQAGKVVYDERQWPMISAYMGPHYGNDVSLPGAGHYQLSLLISPPVSARHVEYRGVWLKPHRVTMSFVWEPPK
jgi:uncharacterized protein involved in high-affinity Fe2+ transport